MNTQFSGHAKQIKSVYEIEPHTHLLLYSPQFGALNEVIVDEQRPVAYPSNIYVRYAHREQSRLMCVWGHELETENIILFSLNN